MALPPNMSPFAAVTRNLEAIGAITLDAFWNGTGHENDIHLLGDVKSSSTTSKRVDTTALSLEAGPSQNATSPTNLLLQASQRAFSSANNIHYEYLEQSGPGTTQCIITIRRPEGTTRSYQSQPIYLRKGDARVAAATSAIDMGALDFIMTGQTSFRDTILAPLDAESSQGNVETSVPTNAVDLIAECCKEWRADQVTPHWTQLLATDQRLVTKHAAAIRIQLSPHLLKVYSTDTVFDSALEAQQACAKDAVDQGILDFIKYGNGQTRPAVRNSYEDDFKSPPAPTTEQNTTLQTFFESLPKPFPEFPNSKTVSELSPIAWLNKELQACRGGRLSSKFIWNSNHIVGLHGCLLRITRPEETRSYLVDPIFHKRNDAKVAVCVLAMSQGLGDYIRAVAHEVQRRIDPAMRKATVEQILPLLSSEASKVEPGAQALYEFFLDRDAFGCVLSLKYNASADSRQYKVDALYATKMDAKVAVAWLAYQEGAIELLRFRGAPPPASYTAFSAKGIPTTQENASRGRGKRKAAELEPESSAISTKSQARRKRRKLAALRCTDGDADEDDETGPSPKPPVPSTSASDKGKGKAGKKPSTVGSLRPQPSQSNSQHYAGQRNGSARNGFGSVGNPQFTPLPPPPFLPMGPYFPYPTRCDGHYDMDPRMDFSISPPAYGQPPAFPIAHVPSQMRSNFPPGRKIIQRYAELEEGEEVEEGEVDGDG